MRKRLGSSGTVLCSTMGGMLQWVVRSGAAGKGSSSPAAQGKGYVSLPCLHSVYRRGHGYSGRSLL